MMPGLAGVTVFGQVGKGQLGFYTQWNRRQSFEHVPAEEVANRVNKEISATRFAAILV